MTRPRWRAAGSGRELLLAPVAAVALTAAPRFGFNRPLRRETEARLAERADAPYGPTGVRGTHETNVPAKQQASQTDARLPRPHGHAWGAAGAEATPGQGTQATDRHDPTEAAPVAQRGGARLPRTARVRKRREFLRLQSAPRRRAGTLFVVITEPASGGGSRLGITVSKRVGGAVVRNRVKRLIREVFRRVRPRIDPPQTVLVIGRPPAATASYTDVKAELARALKVHVD